MDDLKACPFCGEKALDEVSTLYTEYYVQCSNCGTEGPVSNTQKEAVKLWNSRYNDT